jgi:hypothetical protein
METRHVFISHSNQDQAWAQGVCTALEGAGLPCWIAPRDMQAGADWPAQIVEAISSAALMVLILSEPANRSPQVLREVDRAVSRGVTVLALRVGQFALSKNLEYFISMCHWLDADGIDPAETIRKVCVSAQAILAQGGAPSPAQSFAAAGLAPVATSGVAVGHAQGAPLPPGPCEPAFLRQVETELALHLGPIARHLVKQAAGHAGSKQELIGALAAELANDAERRQFVLRCRSLA